MITILDVASACSDPGLASILMIVKSMVTMIQIIAPLLLIVMLAIHFIRLVKNPDEKKNLKKVDNAILALFIIFLIPTLWNVVMSMLGESTTLSDCWNKAHFSFSTNYIDTGGDKSTFYTDPSDYDKGKKKQSTTNKSTGSGSINPSTYRSKLSTMQTPSREEIASKAKALGISDEYLIIIIGTTQREGYVNDPYLYYGWASAMINQRVSLKQMQGWDPSHSGDANYYSWKNIQNGYNNASSDVLKSVYLALTERNTKIVECNGMYKTTPSGYNLNYQSNVYNCAVYETK